MNENEEVHYSGQGQKDIIITDGVEERLVDNLINSAKNSNQHTNALIEEEKTEQQAKLLPKGDKAQKPYDFYFNKCFMSAGLVTDVGGNLAQMDNQTKMEEEDFMEEFNPWNIDVQLLERMLESQDSVQPEIILTEGKDERESVSIGIKVRARAKVGAKVEEKIRNQQLQIESNLQ